MARSFEMTWIASRLRWMKMYKGVRYVISCKALGVAENKEGSYLAANEWWTKKRAEIDGVKATLPNPIIAVLEDWQGGPLTTQLDLMATMRAFVEAHRDAPIPKGVAEAVLGSEEVSRLQLKVDAILDASQAPPGRTIAAHADAWQRHQQALVAANQMTPDRCSNNRICLDHFQTFAGPFSDVDTIDAGN